MGGKRKMLTQTRRKMLGKEMMDAIMAGTFTLNSRPLEEVLDEVNQGIQEERYPIEVDLKTLISIWSGNPAPTAAPAPEQPVPTNHGTVDQIQQAQAAAAQTQQPVPQQNGYTQPLQPDNGAAYAIPEQYPVPQQVEPPNPLTVAVGMAPGQMVPTVAGPQPVQQLPAAQPMTVQQAQAAMAAANSIEIGQPPQEEAVRVDASPVAEWLGLAKQAEDLIKKYKDILTQAKDNASAYLDQIGGPDRSKVGLLNGQIVMRRTYVQKRIFSKDQLAAAHPEIDVDAFTDTSSYYRTEIL